MAEKIFEVWMERSGNLTVGTRESVADLQRKNLLAGAKLKYQIRAATWEEAMAVAALRHGHAPYDPGPPQDCQRCNSVLYPAGSGECWNCGFKVGSS
jgi:hypothetical protein